MSFTFAHDQYFLTLFKNNSDCFTMTSHSSHLLSVLQYEKLF